MILQGLEDVHEGDLVTLVGKDGDEEISMDELADLTGTISYELVCDVGRRVPRVYIKDKVPVEISVCRSRTAPLA